jgi:predicted DNA-binding transcriptional regulator AlpA
MEKRRAKKNKETGEVSGSVEHDQIDLIMGARLARQLGISPTTFWRLAKVERFPKVVGFRNHAFFSQSAVLAWIDRQQPTG